MKLCLKSLSVPKVTKDMLEIKTVSIIGAHKSNLLLCPTHSKRNHDVAVVVDVA